MYIRNHDDLILNSVRPELTGEIVTSMQTLSLVSHYKNSTISGRVVKRDRLSIRVDRVY